MLHSKVWAPLVVLACLVSAPATPARAEEDALLSEIQTHFHATKKWFGMVSDLGLDRGADGTITPRFETLHSKFVLASDAAGQTLIARLPARASGAHVVEFDGVDGFSVRTEEIGVQPVPAEIHQGVVVYRGAVAGGDLLYKLTPTHVDEYIYLREPPSHLRAGARVRHGRRGVDAARGRHEHRGAGQGRHRAPSPERPAGARRRRQAPPRHGAHRRAHDRPRHRSDGAGGADPRRSRLVDDGHDDGGALGRRRVAASRRPGDGGRRVRADGLPVELRPDLVRAGAGQHRRVGSRVGHVDVRGADDHRAHDLRGSAALLGRHARRGRVHGDQLHPDERRRILRGARSARRRRLSPSATRPPSATWVAAGRSRARGRTPMGAPIGSGDALVAGGCDVGGCTTYAERWSAATNTLDRRGSAPVPRGFGTATVLADGRVLVVGGCADPAVRDGAGRRRRLRSGRQHLDRRRLHELARAQGTPRRC